MGIVCCFKFLFTVVRGIVGTYYRNSTQGFAQHGKHGRSSHRLESFDFTTGCNKYRSYPEEVPKKHRNDKKNKGKNSYGRNDRP
eukprot:scaffold56832_cov45-Attheya_sp.AAC.7